MVLVNDEPVSEELLGATSASARARCRWTPGASGDMGVRVVRAPVIAQSQVVRHDSERLARALLHLVR